MMPDVTIAYRTLGTLAPNRDNVVLVTHGNTSGPQMIDPDGSTAEGSWQESSARARRSTPTATSRSARTCWARPMDRPMPRASIPRPASLTARGFPTSPSAISSPPARAARNLGIDQLVAIVGPSYGGFQAFQWAVNYPGMMKGIAAIVTAPAMPRERSTGNVRAAADDPVKGSELERRRLLRSRRRAGDHGPDPIGDVEDLRHRDAAAAKPCPIPKQIEAAIRDEATQWAEGFDANSLIILARALRSFDVTPQFGKIKSKILYVLSRTDRLFPPELAPTVMQAFKSAGLDADYFLLDSEYGHSASGLDAAKWAPRLRQFMESL